MVNIIRSLAYNFSQGLMSRELWLSNTCITWIVFFIHTCCFLFFFFFFYLKPSQQHNLLTFELHSEIWGISTREFKDFRAKLWEEAFCTTASLSGFRFSSAFEQEKFESHRSLLKWLLSLYLPCVLGYLLALSNYVWNFGMTVVLGGGGWGDWEEATEVVLMMAQHSI